MYSYRIVRSPISSHELESIGCIGDRVQGYEGAEEKHSLAVVAPQKEKAVCHVEDWNCTAFKSCPLLLNECEPDFEGVYCAIVHVEIGGQIAAPGLKKRTDRLKPDGYGSLDRSADADRFG